MGGRNLHGISLSDIEKNIVDFSWFMKMEIPDSTFIYYTDRPGGYVDSGNVINSDTATWSEYDILIGALVQSQTSPLDVSYIDLQDLDTVWSNYVLNTGVRFRSVQIYMAWFNVSTGVILGSMPMFDGRTDEATISGNRIKIALVPHRTPWSSLLPARRFLPSCQYIFGDLDTCQYQVLPAPTFSLSAPNSGGSLGAGTYYYRVSAVGLGGETLAATEQSITITAGKKPKITVTAPILAGIKYRIYGRATGAELKIADTTALTYEDDGSITPSGALPVSNTTGAQTTCNRSLNQCQSYQNDSRFGGFVLLPAPNTKFKFGGGTNQIPNSSGNPNYGYVPKPPPLPIGNAAPPNQIAIDKTNLA